MQKEHGDSEHPSDLAGSVGSPEILLPDTRVVIDITMTALFAVVGGRGVTGR